MPKFGLGFQAMDSPETTKPTPTPTALDSPPIHDSPFSNFISNLSPIAHVRNPCVVGELSRLTSPPVVFKSPLTKQRNETNILKRDISLQSYRHDTSKCISTHKERSDRLAETEKPVSEYQTGYISETQNSCPVAGSSETPPSSSSGSVDGFLADPEEDCVDSAKSGIPVPINSTYTPKSDQSGSNGSKKTVLKFDGRSGAWIDAGRNLDALLFSSDNTKNNMQGDLGLYSKLGELEVVERQDGERAIGCPNINRSLPGGHAFTIRGSQISEVQVIENEHRSDHDSVCQRSAEPIDVVKFGDHSENVSGLSHRLVESTMLRSHKESETQRGIRRRCLQFEEVRLCAGGHSSTSSNLVNNVNSLKESNSVHTESRESEGSQMAGATQSSAALMHSQSSDKIPMASKRLGIGLHLNSVVSTVSTKSTNVCVSVQGMESWMPKSSDNCSRPSTVSVKDLAVAQTWKSSSQKADVSEDRDQPSPGKKRRRATNDDGADGCKRCSCKKTKCLKLYCDCFAAGVYCSGPCACQGCFNRPEYEDIVRETREQIESRNPLAFAPKIVPLKPELLPNIVQEAGRASTPSSARHKRGCNCKKSMCLKKYCECYQSNVGCSSGCRCEGCKNVYGRKEEPVAMDDVITQKVMVNESDKVIEGTSIKSSKRVESNTNLLKPQTPLFQHSDPGKDAPKSRFVSGRYLPPPGSDKPVLSPSDKPINKAPPSQGSSERKEAYDRGRSGSTSSIREFESDVPRCTEHSDTLMPKLIISSRTRDCSNVVAQNHQCSESDSFSTYSPLTPMMTRLCGTDMSGDNERTPMRLSSPNKKRVSSPQSHMYKLGSGSTGEMKSGRHFILRSVPSFPPLTPCIESKGADKSHNTDQLQE